MQNINDLRKELFDAIQQVKSGKMKPETAKVISDLGQVLINSAKAEVDYLKQVGGLGTGFIEKGEPQVKMIPRPEAKYDNKKAIDKYAQ